jgi:hypothetical protein
MGLSHLTTEEREYLTTDDPQWVEKAMALPADAPPDAHPCDPQYVKPFLETFALLFETNREMRRRRFKPVEPIDDDEALVLDKADVDAEVAPAIRGDLWGASPISFEDAGRIYQQIQLRGIGQVAPAVVAAPRRRTEPGRAVRRRTGSRRVRTASRGDPSPDGESDPDADPPRSVRVDSGDGGAQ